MRPTTLENGNVKLETGKKYKKLKYDKFRF